MKFCISPTDGDFPELGYPPSPNQLSIFFPVDYSCKQINYGQGEGQVLIEDCEWGFYYNDEGNLSVVLHDGELTELEAIAVIKAVCQKLSSVTLLNWKIVDCQNAQE